MYFTTNQDKMSSATSTKNTKGNRHFVYAFYTNSEYECAFELPDGLDIEDKTQVENYWVKWGTLYIHYTKPNERTNEEGVEQIEPTMEYQPENKWADQVSVHKVDGYEDDADLDTFLPIEDLYEEDPDRPYEIYFNDGEECIGYDTKEKMKEMFDLYVNDMRRFGCITIEAPIKRPTALCCYGDDEAEDWMWDDSEPYQLPEKTPEFYEFIDKHNFAVAQVEYHPGVDVYDPMHYYKSFEEAMEGWKKLEEEELAKDPDHNGKWELLFAEKDRCGGDYYQVLRDAEEYYDTIDYLRERIQQITDIELDLRDLDL